jgi:hypothetical protein
MIRNNVAEAALGPQTSDLRPRTSDLGPRTSDLGPRTSDLRPLHYWEVADGRGPTPNARRPLLHMALSWYYPAGTAVILAMGIATVTFEPMTIVLMMVVLAFGLLYVAVVAEERQMQEATKPRKR